MNLTRMRQFNWQQYVKEISVTYKYHDLRTGDQDILNILFHFHPGKSTKIEFALHS